MEYIDTYSEETTQKTKGERGETASYRSGGQTQEKTTEIHCQYTLIFCGWFKNNNADAYLSNKIKLGKDALDHKWMNVQDIYMQKIT